MKPGKKEMLKPGHKNGRLLLATLAAILITGAADAENPPPAPWPIPPNVEKFVVKTSSSANPEIPFYVRVPRGYTAGKKSPPHRVLFVCPTYNRDALDLMSHEKPFFDMADEKGWFIVIPTFRNAGDVRNRDTCYYYPEKFSGKAVCQALELIAKKYRIDCERILMQGYSGGAQFVHRFAIWAPERVVAVAVNSSSWFDQPNEKSRQLAWLITVGDSDPTYERSLEFVNQLRGIGALPILRSYIGAQHNDAGASETQLIGTFLAFYDELTKAKLGAPKPIFASNPAPLIPREAMPYAGDAQDWNFCRHTPETVEDIPEDARIYLPSEEIANTWGQPQSGSAKPGA
jgi:pimeloyl-ACP methyl ester carboxylesterase